MVFNKNIPQPTDTLDRSQQDLLNNNLQLNTSFGIDHYPFTDVTANLGKHNQVSTPIIIGAAHPTPVASQAIFYGMQDTSNLGTLQYSIGGPSGSAQTPVTSIQSSSAGVSILQGGTTIFDFAGITKCAMATLYAMSTTQTNTNKIEYIMFWNNSTLRIEQLNATGITSQLGAQVNASSELQLFNKISSGGGSGNLSNVYWTIHFHRIQM